MDKQKNLLADIVKHKDIGIVSPLVLAFLEECHFRPNDDVDSYFKIRDKWVKNSKAGEEKSSSRSTASKNSKNNKNNKSPSQMCDAAIQGLNLNTSDVDMSRAAMISQISGGKDDSIVKNFNVTDKSFGRKREGSFVNREFFSDVFVKTKEVGDDINADSGAVDQTQRVNANSSIGYRHSTYRQDKCRVGNRYFENLANAADVFRSNPDFLKRLFSSGGGRNSLKDRDGAIFRLKYASVTLRNDRDFVRQCIIDDGMAIEFAPEKWKMDQIGCLCEVGPMSLTLMAVKRNGRALQFLPPVIQLNPTIFETAVKSDPQVLVDCLVSGYPRSHHRVFPQQKAFCNLRQLYQWKNRVSQRVVHENIRILMMGISSSDMRQRILDLMFALSTSLVNPVPESGGSSVEDAKKKTKKEKKAEKKKMKRRNVSSANIISPDLYNQGLQLEIMHIAATCGMELAVLKEEEMRKRAEKKEACRKRSKEEASLSEKSEKAPL